MPIPRARFAVAVIVLAAISLVPANVSSESVTNVDEVIPAGEYQEYPVALQAGDTVKIDLDVVSGPNMSFYFVDQTGFEQFSAAWSGGSGGFTYVLSLSAVDADSIHRSEPAPSEGIYYLVAANDNSSQSATLSGTIRAGTAFPSLLLTVAIIVIAVVFVIAVVAALMISRSLRAKVHQYAPPGAPSPGRQQQAHMHIAPKPVLQQNIGRVCSRCGAAVPGGASTCPKCGARVS